MSEAIKNSHETGAQQQQYLRNIANAFNNGVIIGASQAADYLLGIPTSRFSRDVIFINTNKAENRTGMKKSTTALQELPDDDTDVFELGLVDKYQARPEKFHHVCLADFAAKYRENYNYNGKDEKSEKFLERKTKRVIRFVGFKKDKSEVDYYREQLMLYFPWTNESEELNDLELADLKEKYESNQSEIMSKELEYNQVSEAELEALRIQFLNEENNFDDEDGFYQMRINNDDEEIVDIDAFPNNNQQGTEAKGQKLTTKEEKGSGYHVTVPPRASDEEIEKILENLNEDQRNFVYTVYEAFQRGEKDLKLFLTGTAGKNYVLWIFLNFAKISFFFS